MMFAAVPLAVNLAIFTVAAVVVWGAGSRLARYADAIAARTGIGRAFLGMVLLGAVTSLPELAIAVTSGIGGTPSLSTNDVLGSAATNLVILAVADAFVRGRPLSAVPGSAPLLLQAALGIFLLGVALGPTIIGDRLILGLGVSSWLLLAGYVAALRILLKTKAPEQWRTAEESASATKGVATALNATPASSGRRLAAATASAAAAILVAGFFLAQTGHAIAEQTGLGTNFFGVAFLALTTSLPEVSTVIGAVRIKQHEMAIADVLGTNLFNVTIIAVNDALYTGDVSVLVEVGPSAALGALLALLLTATFLIGMIERRDRTVLNMGWDSVVIVAIYLAGLVAQYSIR